MSEMEVKDTFEVEPLVDLFKVLADSTRLRILMLLYQRELCVCEISDILDFSQPKVSRHIARLRSSGLVKVSPHAQWYFYHLNRGGFSKGENNVMLTDILQNIQHAMDAGYYQELRADLDKLREKERKNDLCPREEYQSLN